MISGSFARFENCDKDFNSMSQTFGVHEELHHIREATKWTSTRRHSKTPQNSHSMLAKTLESIRYTRRIQPRRRV
jgi:hypothetical protein